MSALDVFWAAPPVARTMTAATVALSLAVHLGPLSGYYVVWLTYKVLTYKSVPQIWRLVSPFLLTGPQLGLIMDPYFLYTYASQLETGSVQFSEPGSFLTYILFIGSVILVADGWYLGGFAFLHCLSLAFAYTSAQEDPNRQVSYFIVTFSAKYLPYAMLLISFLLNGPEAVLHEATGLLAAHLYLFLAQIWPEHGNGRSLIRTPALIRGLFESGDGSRVRAHGTAFAAGRPQNVGQNQTGRGGSWSSGSSSSVGGAVRSAWSSRGVGQRLGGD